MPGDSGVLVVTRVRSTNTSAHEAAGALGIRRSPRPLRGGRFINGSGAWRGEVVNVCLDVIASAAKQSIAAAKERWIASRSLSSGAHSRDPLARNDGFGCLTIESIVALATRTACSLPPCGGELERGVATSTNLAAYPLPNPPPQGRRE
jgi:hypothetical protein